MEALIGTLRSVALFAVLLTVSAPPELACCSGLAFPHRNGSASKACCETAQDDVLAKECCQGGEDFDQGAPTPGHRLEVAQAGPGGPPLMLTGLEPLRSSELPSPSTVDHLYTLHSALLI